MARCDDGALLVPLTLPLLISLKKNVLSTMVQSLPEGRVYCQRVQSLIADKVCIALLCIRSPYAHVYAVRFLIL